MILTDLSQIILAPIFVAGDAAECAKNPSEQSKNILKHFIFNSLRSYFMLHKDKYGDMILACDSGSWRRDEFEFYKYKRREKRKEDTSGINWSFVGEVSNELISDIRTYFPWNLVAVQKAEGDDVIAVLTKHLTETDIEVDSFFESEEPKPILIISSDGDNAQLRKHKHVKQFSPIDKKLIVLKNTPRNLLLEKIVKGDVGDGVPNIRMSDSTFKDGVRQKPIPQKLLDAVYASKNPIECMTTDEERANYLRNEKLVSYEKIPEHISTSIISEYNRQLENKKSKMGLMNYFAANKMNNLYGQISDFYI